MRSFIQIATIASILLFAGNHSIKANETSLCHEIPSAIDRLDCYDRVSGYATAAIGKVDNWSTTSRQSKKSKFTNHIIRNRARETLSYLTTNPSIWLVIQCIDNSTSALFDVYGYAIHHNSDLYGKMKYQVDGGATKKLTFEESDDLDYIGLWGGRKAIPFIKELIGADELQIEVILSGRRVDKPYIGTFTLTGLSAAIDPLRQECGW